MRIILGGLDLYQQAVGRLTEDQKKQRIEQFERVGISRQAVFAKYHELKSTDLT